MVHAHYPLIDLSRLEGGYRKEVGLLDLSSTVIGDINLYGTSTPPSRPGSDRSTREWSESSAAADGRSAPAVSTSQAPVAPTSSTAPETRVGERPKQRRVSVSGLSSEHQFSL